MKRDDYYKLIQSNESILIVFLSATWCKPCESIKPYIKEISNRYPYNYLWLDVDESSEIFASLKSKKQVKGVPTLLAYKKGNTGILSDTSISGTNKKDIDAFFDSLDFI